MPHNPESYKRWFNKLTPEQHALRKAGLSLYYYRHRERLNQLRKLNYQKHRAVQLARSIERQRRLWDTPEEIARRKENRVRRRTRDRYARADNPITHAEWLALIDAWGGICAYCRKTPDKLTQDHIVPISKGGLHTMENIVPACFTCNSRKSNREVWELLMDLGSDNEV